MPNYLKNEVVLVRYPFSDLTNSAVALSLETLEFFHHKGTKNTKNIQKSLKQLWKLSGREKFYS
jgi:hypothetical protein